MLRALFPVRCVLCGALIEHCEGFLRLCPDCLRELPRIVGDRETTLASGLVCVTAARYTDLRGAVLALKFRGRREYAPTLALLMLLALRRHPQDADAVTWVPVHFLRRLTRGYDQGELLARTVAQELGLPLISTLTKHRYNRRQSGIDDDTSRARNVHGVYTVRRGIPGKLPGDNPYRKKSPYGVRVLLVDDVITSGSTLSEAARTLNAAGIGTVGLCLARARD
ncbi:MAG: ComF family protein [Clostridiales bacterium]|jgi:competence protein ComFC|nr:ComF family protein [Clostridiales bacterium]